MNNQGSNRRRKPKILALLAALLVLAGCSTRGTDDDAGDAGAGSGQCSLPDMRNWVQANMRDYYLFYDRLPAVNLEDHSSPESLIRALRVQPEDRFSYVTDIAVSQALFEEGKRFGFGWRAKRLANDELQFMLINPGSPMDLAGFKRGEILVAIDGISMQTITNEQISKSLGSDGAADKVASPVITARDSSGTLRDVTVTKAEFSIETVLQRSVEIRGANRIGYLHFFSFLETSDAELDEAFAYFRQQNINELVLDMRYNGGGRVHIAQELASRIVGSVAIGSDFARVRRNNKYSSNDRAIEYIAEANSLSLSRLFVLATGDTCSASEMVINGLEPVIDVVVVGNATCGKPYGTNGVKKCGKEMNALELAFENANGVGDYWQGIPVDCPAVDNLNDTLGLPTESLFSTAIDYIETGSCTLLASALRSKSRKLAGPNIVTQEIDDVMRR